MGAHHLQTPSPRDIAVRATKVSLKPQRGRAASDTSYQAGGGVMQSHRTLDVAKPWAESMGGRDQPAGPTKPGARCLVHRLGYPFTLPSKTQGFAGAPSAGLHADLIVRRGAPGQTAERWRGALRAGAGQIACWPRQDHDLKPLLGYRARPTQASTPQQAREQAKLLHGSRVKFNGFMGVHSRLH